jgi:hypothetical protein
MGAPSEIEPSAELHDALSGSDARLLLEEVRISGCAARAGNMYMHLTHGGRATTQELREHGLGIRKRCQGPERGEGAWSIRRACFFPVDATGEGKRVQLSSRRFERP